MRIKAKYQPYVVTATLDGVSYDPIDITAMVQCSSEVDDSFDSYVWEMYRDQIFYPDEWNARYDNVYD